MDELLVLVPDPLDPVLGPGLGRGLPLLLLLELLELVEGAEAELAQLGRVLLLLGELLGVLVQHCLQVGRHAASVRPRLAAGTQILAGIMIFRTIPALWWCFTLFSCFNFTISLPWEIRNSFKLATSLLMSFLNFSSMSSFAMLCCVVDDRLRVTSVGICSCLWMDGINILQKNHFVTIIRRAER